MELVSLATLKEVAELAHVSTATVSHAVNGTKPVSDALRARIDAAIEALNYRPDLFARSLKTGRTNIVVFILPELESPMYSSISMDLLRPAALNGLNAIQMISEGNEQRELDLLSSPVISNCRGVVMLTNYLTHAQVRAQLPSGMPLVTLSDEMGPARAHINTSAAAAIRQHIKNAVGAGYQNIGLIINEYPSSEHYIAAYRAALSACGLPTHLSLVKSEDASSNGGYKAMSALLLQKRKIDAVFVCDEAMLLGATRAWFGNREGLCADFMFSGITCPNTAYGMPWIRSITLRTDMVASRVASLLFEEGSGDAPAQDLYVLPRIAPRKELDHANIAFDRSVSG